MFTLYALLLIIGDYAGFGCFMPIEFLLNFLLIIDCLEKIFLVADGLCEFLYIYESIPV